MSRTCNLLAFILFSALLATPRVHAQFATILNIPPDVAPASIGSNTQLNLAAGGVLGDSFAAGVTGDANHIEVNIDGGVVGTGFNAAPADGSGGDVQVNISGGTVGELLSANPGGSVFVTGGVLAGVRAYGGLVRVTGGEITRGLGAYFGGVLEVQAGGDYSQSSLNSWGGQDGAQSVAILKGGTVNDVFVNVTGFLVDDRALVILEGGTVAENVVAFGGNDPGDNQVILSGSTIQGDVTMEDSTTFLMDGGEIQGYLRLHTFFNSTGATADIRGGTIAHFNTVGGTKLNLFGTQFFLDAVDITEMLTEDLPLLITDRDKTLSGLLEDGSAFSYDLSGAEGDTFNSLLTVTLISVNGDFDGDGDVDGRDFLKWQRGESAKPLSSFDLAAWELNFGQTLAPFSAATTVPEPTSCGLVLLAATSLLTRRNRR